VIRRKIFVLLFKDAFMKPSPVNSESRQMSMILLLVPISCWLVIDPTGRWLCQYTRHCLAVAAVTTMAVLKWLWTGLWSVAAIQMRRLLRRMVCRCIEHLLDYDERQQQPGSRADSRTEKI
jgi:hypothetical protein